MNKFIVAITIFSIILLNTVGCLLINKDNTFITVGNRIAKEDLIKIYEVWFDSPYEYMFERDQDFIYIAGRNLHEFSAGINGFLFYGGLVEGFFDYQYDNISSFWSYEIIEKVSGIKVVLEEREFSYFNPDIIIWGSQNLIPDPNDKIYGESCQLIYEVVFNRFFRLMAESYIYLNDKEIYQNERDLYYQNVVIEENYALNYLDARFNSVFPKYQSNNTRSPWTIGMAFGFWFRRSLDGTDDEVWMSLEKMMKIYDNQWLEQLKENYPNFEGI